MNFKKRAFARAVNEFGSKDDVVEVLAFVKAQRVAGELVVSLPGNGGVAAIVFREKERPATIEEQSN
jgi:hypothetical protein